MSRHKPRFRSSNHRHFRERLEFKVKRFVFASSSSVYGDTDQFPQKETHYPLLISPYALSKLAGEYYCRIFSEHFGVETVCLRYFNVFGPKQALDDEYAVVVPKFIHCILNDEQPPIFGNGKQSRDFTYIDDIVDGTVAAIDKCAGYNIYNLGESKPLTVNALIGEIEKALGKKAKIEQLPLQPGDVERTYADVTKARRDLGYNPNTEISDGLKRFVEWFRQ